MVAGVNAFKDHTKQINVYVGRASNKFFLSSFSLIFETVVYVFQKEYFYLEFSRKV